MATAKVSSQTSPNGPAKGPAKASAETPGVPQPAALGTDTLSAANINPMTWLATDYLNHFNEAIMLLELAATDPDCLKDLLAWTPKTYREHFASSHLQGRHIALAAYDAADPIARDSLEKLSGMMSVVLQATCVAMRAQMSPDDVQALAASVVSGLKPLVARAGAVINGEAAAAQSPQVAVDALLKQST